jgi:hypothetical protein
MVQSDRVVEAGTTEASGSTGMRRSSGALEESRAPFAFVGSSP